MERSSADCQTAVVPGDSQPEWTAPVRFAEVDSQDVVFNAHYLTYCDEAMAAFLSRHSTPEVDLVSLSSDMQLVTSTLTWTASARLGDTIEVRVRTDRIGRSSLTLEFHITASGRDCCRVVTTYVLIGADGQPTPMDEQVRVALGSPQRVSGS